MSDPRGEPRPEATAGRRGLAVITAHDDAGWRDVIGQTDLHDFHHQAGYHRVAELRGEGLGYLFSYRDGRHVIALPLLVRPVDASDPTGAKDATSVYGYGGPISTREVPPAVIAAFHAELREELTRQNVVAVFSRLHPLIRQRHLLEGVGNVVTVGHTVSVDLTLPLEDQWAGYSKKTRRIVRKAQEAGVVCVDDRDGAYRHEWVQVYQETMRRVGAPSSYLFDEAYFDLLALELGSALHLFVALVGDRVAAAGLYTICEGIVQAHLGASREEYARLSPTRLLDDTARRWAAGAGAWVFHLGGGVGGREDSLYQYKAGFSDRRHPFATWRWIVDGGAYRALCEERGVIATRLDLPDDDFFPAYRRGDGSR